MDCYNLAYLVRELHSYNNFSLDKLAIHLSCFLKKIYFDRFAAINEVKLILEYMLSNIASMENIFVSPNSSVLEIFLNIDYLNQNIKEHLKYLNQLIQEPLHNIHTIDVLEQEEMYLLQFSIYSLIEWYMMTYFKKPILRIKKIISVAPEEFTESDILESYEIEKLVLPPELIARACSH